MDLKELAKLIALCRKQGIASIKTADLEIQFAESIPQKHRKPYAKKKSLQEQVSEITQDIIENESELTPEQLMFYSVSDIPSSDSAQ